MAGVILASTGIVNSLIWGSIYGGWLCGIGILLMLIVFLYKAFHWNEYARDNKPSTKPFTGTNMPVIISNISGLSY